MSLQNLRLTEQVARKFHPCIWCRELVQIGEKHINSISLYCGDFQNHRWHPECYAAMEEDFSTHHEEEFPAHGFKRGTNEEA
jgi:hypothetical protein